MLRHKRFDTRPQFLIVDLSRHLRPGTFDSEVSVKPYVSNADVKRSGRVMRSHLYLVMRETGADSTDLTPLILPHDCHVGFTALSW